MSLLGSIGIPSIGFTKSNLPREWISPSISLAKYDWHAELSAKCQWPTELVNGQSLECRHTWWHGGVRFLRAPKIPMDRAGRQRNSKNKLCCRWPRWLQWWGELTSAIHPLPGNFSQFAIANCPINRGFTMIYPLKMVLFYSYVRLAIGPKGIWLFRRAHWCSNGCLAFAHWGCTWSSRSKCRRWRLRCFILLQWSCEKSINEAIEHGHL